MLQKNIYFVSYNHKDREWAEWIAWTIEELGLQAVVQAWDFLPGRVWTQEMHTQLSVCTAVVCLLSPDFLTSDYTAAEWQTAFARDPVGKDRTLIPIRIRECEVNALLGTRVYADLVGRDRSACRELLRQALSGGRGKPLTEPNFPGSNGSEPIFPGETVRFAIVLDGEYEPSKRHRVEAAIAHLRKLLNDSNLTIVDVKAGSMIITVEASAATFQAFEELRRRDPDLRLIGEKVLAHWKLERKGTSDPIGSRLMAYAEWLQREFEEHVDPETAKDLVQEFSFVVLSSPRVQYDVLNSPALAAQVARGILLDYQRGIEEENVARKAANLASSEPIDRESVLRLSMFLFEQLSDAERELLENYWSARFEGNELLDDVASDSRAVDRDLNERLRNRMFGEEPDEYDE